MAYYRRHNRPPATRDEVLAYTAGEIWGRTNPDNLNDGLANTVHLICRDDVLATVCNHLGAHTFWRWWREGFDKGAG